MGQSYASLYDAWGNVTGRTVNSTSATLSYDGLDHLTKYDAGSNGQEQYIYDTSGERVLRRSTSGGSTSMTVYAFGLEEHLYSGSGVHQSDTYYYNLGGMLIGEFDGTNTNMFLTDALGSVIETISAAPNSAAVQGNQVYSPYGSSRYQQGSMGTTKGFTGQYNDSVSGLDYYHARYYDPVVGRFLSVDIKLGNMQGADPYAYVGGNPETNTDPTSMRYAPPPPSGGVSQTDLESYVYHYATSNKLGASGLPALLDMYLYNHYAWVLAETYAEYHLHTSTMYLLGLEAFQLLRKLGQFNWNASVQLQELYIKLRGLANSYTQAALAHVGLISESPLGNMELLNQLTDESARALQGIEGSLHVNVDENGNTYRCSFTLKTQVTTDHGKRSIGTLHIGDKVLAFNPKTGKMELEPILHVWINQDHDLVDLTITTTMKGPDGKVTKTSEVVHTNQKHPFFTMEHGFLPVGQIKPGMHLLRADGRVGVVTGWKVVPGTRTMYNLEVAQDHTFTVGAGQWVVHNCGGVPSEAEQAADYAQANNGAAQPGYVGNRPFANDGRGGGQVLPRTTPDGQPITYREYDVNPYTPGVNRGAERVVIGSDGSRWYTDNHYRTFTQF